VYNGKPKTLNLKLPSDLIDEFDIVAKKLGISKSSMIKSLLSDVLPTFREANMLSFVLKQNASVLNEVASLLEINESKKNNENK
jgi:metal-responsive CopG/Arc/MetJ family transcriptional regulator